MGFSPNPLAIVRYSPIGARSQLAEPDVQALREDQKRGGGGVADLILGRGVRCSKVQEPQQKRLFMLHVKSDGHQRAEMGRGSLSVLTQ